ncbi:MULTISPECIES: hypothetical protein [unclassified Rahnella]|uniref:hypothetical protein n=1 Tax=Yersiniaceae TaxID=1903411 RepID=UPI0012969BCF|nr:MULTISPECIES: hypothetical protein [unclassified Rahnella]MCM2446907.1 hypothetical protein [Rahnella sp. CG8]MQB55276.1 hypothetical protein [Rahnella sp. RcJ3]
MNTVEGIIDRLLENLSNDGLRISSNQSVDWAFFSSAGKEINQNFNILSTTITPAMCRLLYAFGWITVPESIISLGSYTGYASAWILCGAQDYHKKTNKGSNNILLSCVDINEEYLNISTENFNKINKNSNIEHILMDAKEFITEDDGKSSIYFIDIDNPLNGKDDYNELLKSILEKPPSNKFILAHDCSVAKFKNVFLNYKKIIDKLHHSNKFYCEIPIDECGISFLHLEGCQDV